MKGRTLNQHNRADCFHRFAVTLTFIKLFKKFTTISSKRNNKMSLGPLKSSSLILEYRFIHLFLIKSYLLFRAGTHLMGFFKYTNGQTPSVKQRWKDLISISHRCITIIIGEMMGCTIFFS